MFYKQKPLGQQIDEISVSLKELVRVTSALLDKLSNAHLTNKDAADATWEPLKALPPDAPPPQFAIIYPENIPAVDHLEVLVNDVVLVLKQKPSAQIDAILRGSLLQIGIDPDTGNPLDDKEEETTSNTGV